MDCPDLALIGSHGYCSQEVVNLLLFGCAVSNTFDGQTVLGDGDETATVLKGVPGTSPIGLLSLFEHYKVSLLCNLTLPHRRLPESLALRWLFSSTKLWMILVLSGGVFPQPIQMDFPTYVQS